MRSICMECGILFDIKPPFENDDETHGYCDECFPMVMVKVAASKRERTNRILEQKEVSLDAKH